MRHALFRSFTQSTNRLYHNHRRKASLKINNKIK
jgi:hypothetical protein